MAEFVEVLVVATGRLEMVPSDWLDDEVLGKTIRALPTPETPAPAPVEAPTGPPEVQTTGPVEDLPLIPAVRDAVLAARAEAAEALAAGPPTEDDTHADIDAFAKKHDIDLGAAKTKAEKVEAITTHLTDVTAATDEHPATGDKE
jgi:hypothetical protein